MSILDFSKAFDKVAHQRLLSELLYYGIQDKTRAWIKAWLTYRSQSVVECVFNLLIFLNYLFINFCYLFLILTC